MLNSGPEQKSYPLLFDIRSFRTIGNEEVNTLIFTGKSESAYQRAGEWLFQAQTLLLRDCSCCWCSSAFTSRPTACFTPPCAVCFIPVVISASCYIYVVCWSLLSALLTGEGELGMNDLLQLSPHGLVLNSLPAVTRTSWSCRHSVIMHRQISFSTSFWNGSSTSAAGKCKST